MSMIRCESCERYVDSDSDPDCFVDKPNYIDVAQPTNPRCTLPTKTVVLCESCREEVDQL